MCGVAAHCTAYQRVVTLVSPAGVLNRQCAVLWSCVSSLGSPAQSGAGGGASAVSSEGRVTSGGASWPARGEMCNPPRGTHRRGTVCRAPGSPAPPGAGARRHSVRAQVGGRSLEQPLVSARRYISVTLVWSAGSGAGVLPPNSALRSGVGCLISAAGCPPRRAREEGPRALAIGARSTPGVELRVTKSGVSHRVCPG